MRQYITIALALGMFALIATPTIGTILSEERVEIVFEKGKVPKEVAWSSKFALTEEGLVSPKPKERTSSEIWLQTHSIPPGLSWRPPSSVNIKLSVNGSAHDGFPLTAYVRYGCDGVHWSTWYYMPEREKKQNGSLKTYEYRLRIPQSARQIYQGLMREWWKTEPNWSSDEDAFCRWLIKKKPDFFTREFPFIGYVQFLFENWNLEPQVKIKSLSAQMAWGVGGIASIPKSGKRASENKKWHFDIREVQKDIREQYPNPFGPEAPVPYKVTKETDVTISIYDVSGQLVHKVDLGKKMPGEYIFEWDGRDDNNKKFPSGVYFLAIEKYGKVTSTKKYVIIK